MLKYNITVSDGDIQKHILEWREKYLSPDLSFVTGVTSQVDNISMSGGIEAANRRFTDNPNTLNIGTTSVTRTGYAVVKGYKYKVESARTYDYTYKDNDTDERQLDYYYVLINGKYYYAYLDSEEGVNFKINNFLTYSWVEDRVGEFDLVVPFNPSDGFIEIDRVFWIEDNFVTIDGKELYYDRELNGLCEYEGGVPLTADQITDCNDIYIVSYDDVADYEDVVKFILTKKDDNVRGVEDIGFVKYFNYVLYKDVFCPVRMDITESGYAFVCEVPKYALSATSYGEDYEEYETVDFDVMFFKGCSACTKPVLADKENLDGFDVFDLDDLHKIDSFVIIDENRFNVQCDLLNSNTGKLIRIELLDNARNIDFGTKIYLKNIDLAEEHLEVQKEPSDYEFNDDEPRFVVYDGEKHMIEDNICDTVVIAESEYNIEYPNGKVNGKDCLVLIGEDEIPMKILYKNGKYVLQRYGLIVKDSTRAATVGEYNIKTYDGVYLNGKKYPVTSGTAEGDDEQVVIVGGSNTHVFNVIDVKGSSMLICEPFLNDFDFTDDFREDYSTFVCNDVVLHKDSVLVYTKNTMFGEREITRELGFKNILNDPKPTSTDDYYNLFDDLVLFYDETYINVALPFIFNAGGAVLQGNLLDKDFVEKKTEELINPIVDMEKDVYTPKYIVNGGGKYSGSSTEFRTIDEIRINLHFRTRDEYSWKVNDGYNLVDTAELYDNWFVTDFYPYKDMLDMGSGDTLQETSDIMGLLYFTNDDIFYQKQKVGKSFVRLSFYDSTDSNTQSLLCNSCVFFDYHSMFKTYMDNSQKNINFYCVADKEKQDIKVNRISVKTELLTGATKKSSEDKPTIDEAHRISSRLTVKSKYETTTSSEGFYLYVFREYSENLRPKPIYMKVEFNHAGIGRTIPFTIPMKWETGNTHPQIETPTRTLTLTDDLDEMKEGIPLSRVKTQLYIPLYAVYDFKNKEYGYVFDSRYVEVKDGIVNLNLFELKVMDETVAKNVDEKREDIRFQRQVTPLINVNDKQFEIMEPKCTTDESNT